MSPEQAAMAITTAVRGRDPEAAEQMLDTYLATFAKRDRVQAAANVVGIIASYLVIVLERSADAAEQFAGLVLEVAAHEAAGRGVG